jgi:sugar fermentation stimulation protein A
MTEYKFKEKLIEGVIESRPNRFIMMVRLDGDTHICHCPFTGRIGNIVFDNIPCLLSVGNSKERKTRYTVEAISLSPVGKTNKAWIGINQVRANAVVEHYIRAGALERMLGPVTGGINIKREVRLGKSRIDFLVGLNYLEIKSPLNIMPMPSSMTTQKHSKFNSFERIIKHFDD